MTVPFVCRLCLIVALLLPPSHGDIPVHCTQFQMLGLWRFHVGQWKDGDPMCGGSHPDKAVGHKELTPPVRDAAKKEPGGYWLSDNFKELFTMDATLKDWRISVDKISDPGLAFHPGAPQSMPEGMWTMVYDEGFNIHMEAGKSDPNLHSMFAFSKYTLRPGENSSSTDNVANKQHSHCGHTLLGWYKIMDKGTLAIKNHFCYWGERVEHLYPTLLKKHEAQMMPQGLIVNSKSGRLQLGSPATRGPVAAMPHLGAGAVLLENVSRAASGSRGDAILGGEAARDRINDISIGNYIATNRQRAQDAMKNGSIVRYQIDPDKIQKFIQSSAFDQPYHEPSTVQELINRWSPPPTLGLPALPGFSSEQIIGPVRERAFAEQQAVAKARGYASLKELTPEDMHEHWGAPAHNHHATRKFSLDGQELGPDDWRHRSSFDWRKVSLMLGNASSNRTIKGFVPPVPDQGNCGSCYAVAATSMLTARIMLRYPELYHQRFMDGDRVSWHQQLDCNHYVQGCDGGYPLLVSRWSMENDVVLKGCAKAAGRNECSFSAQECQQDRFRVRHFRYVGGSFGRCGSKRLCEAGIREELYKGGPMVVSVEPSDHFNAYTGGILHEVPSAEKNKVEAPPTDEKDCTKTECYTWRKIDHSMLLVGWGEDNRYGKSCMAMPDEDAMEEKCSLHKDDEEKCKAAGCKYGGFPYWIIQNSWSPHWGDNGVLNVGPRGKNPLMAEMMAVSADIVRKEDLGNYFSLSSEASLLERSSSAKRDDAKPDTLHRRFVRVKHAGHLHMDRGAADR